MSFDNSYTHACRWLWQASGLPRRTQASASTSASSNGSSGGGTNTLRGARRQALQEQSHSHALGHLPYIWQGPLQLLRVETLTSMA